MAIVPCINTWCQRARGIHRRVPTPCDLPCILHMVYMVRSCAGSRLFTHHGKTVLRLSHTYTLITHTYHCQCQTVFFRTSTEIGRISDSFRMSSDALFISCRGAHAEYNVEDCTNDRTFTDTHLSGRAQRSTSVRIGPSRTSSPAAKSRPQSATAPPVLPTPPPTSVERGRRLRRGIPAEAWQSVAGGGCGDQLARPLRCAADGRGRYVRRVDRDPAAFAPARAHRSATRSATQGHGHMGVQPCKEKRAHMLCDNVSMFESLSSLTVDHSIQ